MPTVTIRLDGSLAGLMGRRSILVEAAGEASTVRELLGRAGLPCGFIGLVVCRGRQVDLEEPVPPAGDLQVYGIYSGG